MIMTWRYIAVTCFFIDLFQMEEITVVPVQSIALQTGSLINIIDIRSF